MLSMSFCFSLKVKSGCVIIPTKSSSPLATICVCSIFGCAKTAFAIFTLAGAKQLAIIQDTTNIFPILLAFAKFVKLSKIFQFFISSNCSKFPMSKNSNFPINLRCNVQRLRLATKVVPTHKVVLFRHGKCAQSRRHSQQQPIFLRVFLPF